MSESKILQLLKETRAILSGHFVLSSGLHSDTYVQCARLFMHPWHGRELAELLAAKVKESGFNPTIVVAPAMGGVIVGQEVAAALKVKSVFLERVNGTFELRRGFEISPEDAVLVVEDVVTTGKSSQETIGIIEQFGAKTIAVASIINRSNSAPEFIVPLISLIKIDAKTYQDSEVPAALAAIPVTKPGSRFLQK